MLRGRRTECAELDRLLEALPSGHSAILVLRGEAGYGKTALLEYLSERAAGCRLARAAGVESEMELPSHGIGHPRERRMVASCSWRPEREAGRLPGVPTDHLPLLAALGNERRSHAVGINAHDAFVRSSAREQEENAYARNPPSTRQSVPTRGDSGFVPSMGSSRSFLG